MVPDTLFVSTLVVMPVLGVAGVVDVVLVVAKVGAGLAILVNGLEQKGLQSRAMHIPRFMRRVNRVLTNPVLGMFAWVVPPLAVVHHLGRKSGRSYRTPVVAFRSAAGFVIPMTYGRDVDWARNIIRAQGCELERLGRRVTLRNPRIVTLETAEHRLPAALRPFFRAADFPGFVLLDEDTHT